MCPIHCDPTLFLVDGIWLGFLGVVFGYSVRRLIESWPVIGPGVVAEGDSAPEGMDHAD